MFICFFIFYVYNRVSVLTFQLSKFPPIHVNLSFSQKFKMFDTVRSKNDVSAILDTSLKYINNSIIGRHSI